MRPLLVSVAAGVLAASTLSAASVSSNLALTLEANPGQTQRVLVVMKDAAGARAHIQTLGHDRAAVKQALQQNAALSQASLLGDLGGMGVADSANVRTNWLANTVIMDATPEQVAALAERADVAAVELNETVQLIPFESRELPVGKFATGDDEVSTWGLKAAKALEARSTYAVDGSGVVVGILDTGYDGAHPLLAGKIIGWKSFISDSQTQPIDDNGHGSHCAGTIGGSSGGAMEIGMAPGASFVAGKILSGSGSGTWEGVVSGMEWIVDPDGTPNSGDEPRLVSNSWGGGSGSEALHTAVKNWVQLGIAPIFAAGNSGPGASTMGYPGAYPEAYSVGATTVENTIASFSSRGPATVGGQTYIQPDISAPGKDVTSVKAGGGYWTISGTSMATPHVAGLSALLFQANPSLTIEQLQETINSTSIDEGPAGKDNDWGNGHIDALAALGIVISGGKIVGSVKDAGGNPIPHAKLVVDETGVKVRLKADGSFAMTLPEGQYNLSLSAFGFVSGSQADVSVTAGNETQVDIVMEAAASGTVSGVVTGNGAAVEGTVKVLDTPLAATATGADGAFSVSLPAGTYKVAISAYGFESGVSAEFTVAAGEDTQVSLDLAKLPPVLVVDDDDGKGYESFYAAALGDKPHKLVGHDQLTSLSGNYLAQYEVVVWFTGDDYQGSLDDQDQAALGAYLDLGGRLLVSGQDIGYELKSKAFYGERLGASFVKDTAADKNVTFEGLSFSLEGGDGAGNQKYPDVIDAAGGTIVATYGDGTAAGVKVENGNSKVLYFSFGLEGIASAEGRSGTVAKALEYLSPTAAEMAARIEALQARTPASEAEAHDDSLLAEALTNLVSTRVAEDAGSLAASSDRQVRRMAAFEALR